MGSHLIPAAHSRVLFSPPLDDQTPEEIDERSVARKYGIRELVYPGSEQLKTIVHFLNGIVDTGPSWPVPQTAVMPRLDFLQGIVNRQHITKGPRMGQEEFDFLQTPYYLAARIVTKLVREKKLEAEKGGRVYHTTYNALGQFIELLRNLLDPGCYWLRLKIVPEGIAEHAE